jgi:lipoprotein-releasing system ATP-binding protein
MLPQMIAAVPRRQAREKAAGLLTQVGLAPRTGHRPARLSGGEQQRVAIARALANDPKILLGDEPTGNLDHATGESVLDTLLDLVRDTGLSDLIATHNRPRHTISISPAASTASSRSTMQGSNQTRRLSPGESADDKS